MGIIATRNAGTHLALFFVDGNHHRQGVGRSLWNTVLEENTSPIITVHSSLYAVDVYKKLGFIIVGELQSDDGISYVPMEYRMVCDKDCPCPSTAAMASIQVRPTLLKGSCSVSDHPDVCECVRSAMDLGFLAPKLFTILAHSRRQARILAISMKWFMPMAQKKLRRGAKASTSIPALIPARR